MEFRSNKQARPFLGAVDPEFGSESPASPGAAIITYLCEKHDKHHRLIPVDPVQRARPEHPTTQLEGHVAFVWDREMFLAGLLCYMWLVGQHFGSKPEGITNLHTGQL